MGGKRYQQIGQEHWAGHIAGQRTSGLSIGAYCKQQGLTESAFYNRRKRLMKAPGSTEGFARIDEPALRRGFDYPARESVGNDTGLIITTPNGYRVQAVNAALGIEAAQRVAAC